jgi:hypothetical protein
MGLLTRKPIPEVSECDSFGGVVIRTTKSRMEWHLCLNDRVGGTGCTPSDYEW